MLLPKKATCLGVNNTELEQFIELKYGFTCLDEEGYPWGEKQRSWTTFRARSCGGKAISEEATRCEDCNQLFLACSNARSKHN